MNWFTSALRTLGLEHSLNGCKIAVFSFKKGKPCLVGVKNCNVKPLDISKDSLFYQNSPLVVSVLNASEVLVRDVELPDGAHKTTAAIEFQAEPDLPYSIEEGLVIPFSQKKSDKTVSFQVFSTKKDVIKRHLDDLERFKITAEAVSAVPAALASFNSLLPCSDGMRFLIHIGEKETACILLKGQELLGARSVAIGEEHFLEAFGKKLQLSLEEARKALYEIDADKQFNEDLEPFFVQTAGRWKLELCKTILALSLKNIDQVAADIFITGQISTLPPVLSLLQEGLSYCFKIPPAQVEHQLNSNELQTYAISLGLALSFLPCSRQQLNFRVGELANPKPFKHLKKTLLYYLASCLLLSSLLFGAGRMLLAEQEGMILSKIQMISEGKKDSGGWAVQSKAISYSKGDSPLSKQISRLRANKCLFGKSPYPLLPQIPRVCDFLAWLCSHPCVVNAESSNEKIRINRLTYALTNRPTKKKSQERFKAKVEFEFTSSSPKTAREFHESLLKAGDVINVKDQFLWNASANNYKVSFLLKDKTFYY